jgi:hypothetical protein
VTVLAPFVLPALIDDAMIGALADAIGRRFPGYPPYGGAFDEVIPHLTVGLDQPAEVLDSVALAIEPGLPIVARVSAALLIQGSAQRSSWHTAAELPLRSRA